MKGKKVENVSIPNVPNPLVWVLFDVHFSIYKGKQYIANTITLFKKGKFNLVFTYNKDTGYCEKKYEINVSDFLNIFSSSKSL